MRTALGCPKRSEQLTILLVVAFHFSVNNPSSRRSIFGRLFPMVLFMRRLPMRRMQLSRHKVMVVVGYGEIVVSAGLEHRT